MESSVGLLWRHVVKLVWRERTCHHISGAFRGGDDIEVEQNMQGFRTSIIGVLAELAPMHWLIRAHVRSFVHPPSI